MPVGNGKCGRWRDHRQVVNGILYRLRTGIPWRDLPERFGPWKTVYERHRLWSNDGTWETLLRHVQAIADSSGQIDWDVSVDSTSARAHQHAAGARREPPKPVASQKGARSRTKRGNLDAESQAVVEQMARRLAGLGEG
jgi:transposase